MVAIENDPAEVRFTLRAPVRGPVFLVGDFNGWRPGITPMERRADGWIARVRLPAGRHRYGFATRGLVLRDREAPEEDATQGWPWSVVAVPPQDTANKPQPIASGLRQSVPFSAS
jgi:1,4-alpha-glucan branching enzyme